DRAQNLHSMPARLGVGNAMWIARTLHAAALACLAAAWLVDARLSALFAAGIVIVAALLVYEHLTVAHWGTTRIALAFFTLNGVTSCALGLLGILDILLRSACPFPSMMSAGIHGPDLRKEHNRMKKTRKNTLLLQRCAAASMSLSLLCLATSAATAQDSSLTK